MGVHPQGKWIEGCWMIGSAAGEHRTSCCGRKEARTTGPFGPVLMSSLPGHGSSALVLWSERGVASFLGLKELT